MTASPDFPKRRTRRGRRRGSKVEPLVHLGEMRRCVECGDVKNARAAAQRFVASLPPDPPDRPVPRGTYVLSPAITAYLKLHGPTTLSVTAGPP